MKKGSFFPISKLIRYFTRAISERTVLKKIIKDNQKFLMPGKYRVTATNGKKIIYLNDNLTENFLKNNVMHLSKQKPAYLKVIIKGVVRNLLTISNSKNMSSEDFKGSLLMITRNHDIRIFDFMEKRSLVILTNKAKLRKLYSNYEEFSKYFSIPKTCFNLEKLSYTEEYLEFTPYNLWGLSDKERVVKEIFSSYKKYFEATKKIKKSATLKTEHLFYEFQKKVDHRSLVNLIREILIKTTHNETRWPLVNQHGDLGYHNILLSKSNCYIIDWEDSNEYVFFYDILNYFYTSRNMDCYFRGEIDDKLSELFQIFNMDYDRESRMLYFIVFIMQRSIWEVQINPFPKEILNRVCLIIEDNR